MTALPLEPHTEAEESAEEKVARARHTTDEVGRDVDYGRQKITQGFCPRSNQRIMPGGNLRPACSFCDCGEYR